MKPEEVTKYFEEEMKKVNGYIKYVLDAYKEQGINPSPSVKETAKMNYILATLNKLKGAKNDRKPTTRKKASK